MPGELNIVAKLMPPIGVINARRAGRFFLRMFRVGRLKSALRRRRLLSPRIASHFARLRNIQLCLLMGVFVVQTRLDVVKACVLAKWRENRVQEFSQLFETFETCSERNLPDATSSCEYFQ